MGGSVVGQKHSVQRTWSLLWKSPTKDLGLQVDRLVSSVLGCYPHLLIQQSQFLGIQREGNPLHMKPDEALSHLAFHPEPAS